LSIINGLCNVISKGDPCAMRFKPVRELRSNMWRIA
jgi:hypothetical protein